MSFNRKPTIGEWIECFFYYAFVALAYYLIVVY